ncbi:MAG: tRNA glutamyl-Q(34) synthetase GluQRS [Caulobacterales bacterium]
MFVTRFAPSPTGYLHLGHAYSAVLAHDAARAAGGQFLLRIEDIDETRCRPEFDAAILEDLAWLGLSWDGEVLRQSTRRAVYESYRAQLEADGLLYRCFKTRKEILDDIARAPHGAGEGPDGLIYVGATLPPDEEKARLEKGESFAWRLSLQAARQKLGDTFDALRFAETGEKYTGMHTARPDLMGDVVLARKDLGVAYHLAAVIDDALQNVTHVIRGEDLFASTHIHVLLQALLGLPTPAYRHHALIVGPDGKRYAKRDQSVTLRALRAESKGPEDIRRLIGLT